MKQITLGVLAHVDSGKTTLCEGLLYVSGATRKLGRVDHQDTLLDNDVIEQERGITIFSKQACFAAGDTVITLLDTPGHIDFSPEAERVLQVLDYALLIINGAEGVQSHTLTLWRLLEKKRIPTIIFINKMDLSGITRTELMQMIHSHLSASCVDFSSDLSFSELAEECAASDELLMEMALSDHGFSETDIPRAISSRHCFPVIFGSALRLDNLDKLINVLSDYTESPEYNHEFGAKVYKVSTDSKGERVTHLKITGGTLVPKQTVNKLDSGEAIWSEKVNELRLYQGPRFTPIAKAEAGTICAVTGLSKALPGDGLGIEPDSVSNTIEPVLIYRVSFPEGTDLHKAVADFSQLNDEEPVLKLHWIEQTRELLCELMGSVQIEVLTRRIMDRFGYAVSFLPVSIAYKETISEAVEGVGHYEPLRHYAEVHVLLEPLPRGSGLQFRTVCSENLLSRNWQRLILTHFQEKKHLGVLTGSPITDMRITLLSGKAHLKHTEGGDFRQATYRAIRQGLMRAKSILLEPWYSFRIMLPKEQVGHVLADLTRMNADFSAPEIEGALSVITGFAPVRLIQNYQQELISYTHGNGSISTVPYGYRPSDAQDEIVESIGYDPEADLRNTPDSVFCDHGAGYAVKWNEVEKLMHLESGFTTARLRDTTASTNVQKNVVKKVLTPFEEDEALLKIFERTYGPIRRNPLSALRTQRIQRDTSEYHSTALTDYLLVDGYNILFAWNELKKIADVNMDAARTKLADILCNYRGFTGCNVILVFDAYKVPDNAGSIVSYHDIYVVYTKEAETADTFIEKATYTLAKERRVRVATSDGPEQMIILGNGAERVSAKLFREEVLSVEKSILSLLGGKKSTYSIGALSELTKGIGE